MSKLKTGRLLGRWSKRDNDYLFSFPTSKSDGGWLHYIMCIRTENYRTLLQELELRGFDPKTLRIQVDRKAPKEPSSELEETRKCPA